MQAHHALLNILRLLVEKKNKTLPIDGDNKKQMCGKAGVFPLIDNAQSLVVPLDIYLYIYIYAAGAVQ